MAHESEVVRLGQRLEATWAHLANARRRAAEKREELCTVLQRVGTADLSVVAFGSLARGEFTEDSDADWTLLVDGAADPKHFEDAQKAGREIQKVVSKKPGREGTFGETVFSHDLVHRIGGDADTNRNTTRRSLMLLESIALGRDEAYERVIRAILSRYLLEDRTFVQRTTQFHVPRFLLNDFARYWRTMAVDFAYKRRERLGKGAVIRNVKLRFSRKLLYVSALLTCFGCELRIGRPTGCADCPTGEEECIQCLRSFIRRTPLEVVASVFLHVLAQQEGDATKIAKTTDTANKMFGAYDSFIGIMAEKRERGRLEALDPEDVDEDELFQHVRELSQDFRDSVLDLFFDMDDQLARLTRFYGVF